VIKQAIETTQVKARAQYIDGEPPIIVDGGHNPSGVSMLSLMLMYLTSRNKKIYAVMGMVDSKDYVDCVRTVAEHCEKLFAVDGFAPNSVKKEDIAETADFLTETETGTLEECTEKAKALALENNGVVVVCGSLYLASEYMNTMM
jgi:dihydrofolate synthase/folylpolyglutamate synthase